MSPLDATSPIDPRNVGQWIRERARLNPERTALVGDGRRLSYDELDAESTALARRLVARGLVPGDRVATLAENRVEVVILLFACAKAGLILFPMNWRLTNAELAPQLALMTPSAWWVSPAQRGRVDDALTAIAGPPQPLEELADVADVADVALPQVGEHDGLAIIATSGTTGRPKGVLLTHANFFWTNLSLDLVAPVTGQDVVLQVLPQFHIGGWNVQPMQAWLKGATVILESSFDPGRVLEIIERERVTTMAGVPTTFLMLAEHERFATADLSSLTFAVVGGAAMPATLVDQWHQRGVSIQQGYGLTEAAPNVFCLDAREAAAHPCSVGHPYPFVEVALADLATGELVEGPGRGELLVRGPAVFPGYWRDPAATEAVLVDGWLRTGDIASRDAAGYYSIAGRAKEMYVSGGENVYPVEVENVLTNFPGVVSAAVVSVAHPTWGEAGVAFVEVAPGATIDLGELERHCRAYLASFKVPARVWTIDELPRTPVGKIDKLALRAMAARASV